MFDSFEKWANIEKECLKKNGFIDTTNRFEKASLERVKAQKLLDSKINELKNIINSPTIETSIK